jgi:DNA-binding Lrp family transcriptional regulator
MELKQVLAEVPGLNRQFVYYLESQGYIRPLKVPRARIARRYYRDEDVRVLRDVWRYYQRGYSVQASYRLSRREPLGTYVTFPVSKETRMNAFETTTKQQSVVEASAVYGSTFDFIVRTDSPDEADIYYGLLPALAETSHVGAATVLRTIDEFQRPSANERAGQGLIAYVFMKVPGKDIADVMTELQEFEEVVEAATVYGETDIVAKVITADQAALDTLVMEHFHKLEKVESTRTFIVIGGLHWERSAKNSAASLKDESLSDVGLGDDGR